MSTPTTPKTPTPPTLPAGVTKICHIVKRANFDGYGFNLHSEKVKPGQFIGKIDANSPAEAGGLKEGDRILEVNGVSIGNETHKQVVARIKAIANEVRLLLIDVDGKGDETMAKVKAAAVAATTAAAAAAASTQPKVVAAAAATNGNMSPTRSEGTKQELPGASANISSISVTSMKRASNASGSTLGVADADVVDKAMPAQHNGIAENLGKQPDAKPSVAINNNNTLMSTMPQPPPPSAAVATVNNISNNNNNNTNTNNNNGGMIYTTNGTNGNASLLKQPTPTPSTPNTAVKPASPTGTGAGIGGAVNRAGSLNLPLTAAEMRAKLASKKKYDPKNESVDLKKKYDIIQKL